MCQLQSVALKVAKEDRDTATGSETSNFNQETKKNLMDRTRQQGNPDNYVPPQQETFWEPIHL